jgi:Holliday junction resolvase RusA-like endonuclease
MAIEPIKLTLPIAPSVNNLYFTLIKNGKPMRIPSGDAKKFKKAVEKICVAARTKPFIGEVAVSLNIYRPRRVGDTENYFKATFDSLKGFAWLDDKQITEVHAWRHEDPVNPRIEIEITPVGLF